MASPAAIPNPFGGSSYTKIGNMESASTYPIDLDTMAALAQWNPRNNRWMVGPENVEERARKGFIGTQMFSTIMNRVPLRQIDQSEKQYGMMLEILGLGKRIANRNYGVTNYDNLDRAGFAKSQYDYKATEGGLENLLGMLGIGPSASGSYTNDVNVDLERLRQLRSEQIARDFTDRQNDNLAHLQQRGFAGSTLAASLANSTERGKQDALTSLEAQLVDRDIDMQKANAQIRFAAQDQGMRSLQTLMGLLG